MSVRAPFIVLDGVDGCGKSTQAARLVEALGERGFDEVLHLREPGSTSLGEGLRSLLLSREHRPSPEVEVLMFAASRRQTLDELVGPALERGAAVVCERFHASTFAYQGFAGDVGEDRVMEVLLGWANDPEPDLTLVLDLPPGAASERRGEARDRIEDKGLTFQERVAEGYRRYVERSSHARLVDGAGTPEEVERRVLEEVDVVLG